MIDEKEEMSLGALMVRKMIEAYESSLKKQQEKSEEEKDGK